MHARLLEERHQFKEAETMYMASLEQARLLNFISIENELVNDINRNKIKHEKYFQTLLLRYCFIAIILALIGIMNFFMNRKDVINDVNDFIAYS